MELWRLTGQKRFFFFFVAFIGKIDCHIGVNGNVANNSRSAVQIQSWQDAQSIMTECRASSLFNRWTKNTGPQETSLIDRKRTLESPKRISTRKVETNFNDRRKCWYNVNDGHLQKMLYSTQVWQAPHMFQFLFFTNIITTILTFTAFSFFTCYQHLLPDWMLSSSFTNWYMHTSSTQKTKEENSYHKRMCQQSERPSHELGRRSLKQKKFAAN